MNARGFTLMETLVALVIFSLSCMALLDLYSTSTRAKAAHDSLISRTTRAEALLHEIDLAKQFQPSSRGTYDDGMNWEVVMTPVSPQLVRIDILVIDKAGREARLQTLRLPSELRMESSP